jgi:hypothetical protein
MGVSFTPLPLHHPDKKIYGFGPILPVGFSFTNVFDTLLNPESEDYSGQLTDDTAIFRKFNAVVAPPAAAYPAAAAATPPPPVPVHSAAAAAVSAPAVGAEAGAAAVPPACKSSIKTLCMYKTLAKLSRASPMGGDVIAEYIAKLGKDLGVLYGFPAAAAATRTAGGGGGGGGGGEASPSIFNCISYPIECLKPAISRETIEGIEIPNCKGQIRSFLAFAKTFGMTDAVHGGAQFYKTI